MNRNHKKIASVEKKEKRNKLNFGERKSWKMKKKYLKNPCKESMNKHSKHTPYTRLFFGGEVLGVFTTVGEKTRSHTRFRCVCAVCVDGQERHL